MAKTGSKTPQWGIYAKQPWGSEVRLGTVRATSEASALKNAIEKTKNENIHVKPLGQ